MIKFVFWMNRVFLVLMVFEVVVCVVKHDWLWAFVLFGAVALFYVGIIKHYGRVCDD